MEESFFVFIEPINNEISRCWLPDEGHDDRGGQRVLIANTGAHGLYRACLYTGHTFHLISGNGGYDVEIWAREAMAQ